MFGFEYLQQVLTNLYKEHTEKLINQKVDEFRESALAKMQQERLTLHRTVALLLAAMFFLLAVAHFWPEPTEAKLDQEEEKNR